MRSPKKKIQQNKTENWIECILELPEPIKDSVTNRLFEIGAQGISETGTKVSAFFLEKNKTWPSQLKKYLKSLRSLQPALPSINFKTRKEAAYDWSEKYKQYFTGRFISKQVYLLPQWEDPPPVDNDVIFIVMDPGQAFGTGTHPTTQLCIRLLEGSSNIIASPRVLDVGTGTGILSIAAAKLGAVGVLGIDNDPVAVEVARENARHNNTQIAFSDEPIEKIRDKFNIIVSNILLETHLELAAHYARMLTQAGELILSGLLKHQEAELNETLVALGFIFDSSVTVQEWLALRYVKY